MARIPARPWRTLAKTPLTEHPEPAKLVPPPPHPHSASDFDRDSDNVEHGVISEDGKADVG
jgi:hypothetical protein